MYHYTEHLLFHRLTLSIVAPALGLAQAAMDIHMERVKRAGIGNTFYTKMSEAPITHFQIAQAQLKIDSAELHLYRAVDKLDAFSGSRPYDDY